MPDEIRRQLPDEVVDQLLAGARTEEEIVGPGGLLAQLTKRLVERALEVELTDHLGYEPHQEPPGGAGNTRNGGRRKTLVTEHGPVEIRTPRDRDGSFEPKLVRKRQRRFEGFDEKILALYSRGMSTRDIEAHLRELYGVSVGRDLISRVTDAVMDDVRAWQHRPLEDVYPVVFLDALVLKIRDGGSVQRKACYLALGVGMDGSREVLGLWFQETEGAKFWMQVLTELKHRGVQRHPHLLRRRAHRVPGGDRGGVPADGGADLHRAPHPRIAALRPPPRNTTQVVKDLRPIYTAIDPDHALARARGVRAEMGRAAPAGRPSLARLLGARHPVPGVPARGPSRDLHHQRDRGAQPPATQSGQDQGQLPHRGRRPQTASTSPSTTPCPQWTRTRAGPKRCWRSKSTSETDCPTNRLHSYSDAL